MIATATALGIAGLATSLGSSIFGSSSSAAANRKAEKQLQEQRAKDNAWYNRKYNENFADTEAGQDMIRRANESADKYWKKASGAAAVGGATSAEAAQVKENATKGIGDTIATMSAKDTARKDSLDATHQANERSYAQQQAAIEQQKGQNIAAMASGLGNAAMSAASIAASTPASEKDKNTGAETQKNVSIKDNANIVNDLLAFKNPELNSSLNDKYKNYYG